MWLFKSSFLVELYDIMEGEGGTVWKIHWWKKEASSDCLFRRFGRRKGSSSPLSLCTSLHTTHSHRGIYPFKRIHIFALRLVEYLWMYCDLCLYGNVSGMFRSRRAWPPRSGVKEIASVWNCCTYSVFVRKYQWIILCVIV